jgi:hypothetical protein
MRRLAMTFGDRSWERRWFDGGTGLEGFVIL